MKPLLQIKVPNKLPLSDGGLSGDQFIRMISLLRTRLLENYEVVIIPEGIGMDIDTERMVKLTIDSSTNFDELFKHLDEISETKTMAEEFQEFAKHIPEGIMDKLNIPNKNGNRYLLEDVGIGEIPHFGPEITFAPRGIIGDNGKLNITSMDIMSPQHTTTKVLKSRQQHPVLFDPFASLKKNPNNKDLDENNHDIIYVNPFSYGFKKNTKTNDNFHVNFMPQHEYLMRSYDGDQDVDPEKCLDNYWINIIGPINQSGLPSEDILSLLKYKDIDPNTIKSLELDEKYDSHVSPLDSSVGKTTTLLIHIKKGE